MKENDILKQVLKKYDLMLPLTWMEKRKVLRAKKRTLASILAGSEGGRARISWSLAFYYMMRGMGLDVTAAAGARAGFAAAMFSLSVITGSALFIAQRNFPIQWLPGQVEVARIFAKVSAGSGTVKGDAGVRSISGGGTVVPGETVATGDSSALLLKAGSEVTIAMLHDTDAAGSIDKGATRIELKGGCVMSDVAAPFNGTYEVRTPDSTVRVTGTIFSVAYTEGKTSVMVYRGSVSLTHFPSGNVNTVEAGSFMESGKPESGRKLNAKENELFVKFESAASSTEGTADESVMKDLNVLYDKALKEGSEKKGMTLDDIRARYGGINDIILYSGKRYKGAVISRGAVTRIMTVNGVVSVPSDSIKSVIPE